MKWIGQHIYDLASRFRNDVFLEDIATGTIASGAHLGLDSNNKIVKAVDGGGDLTSIVAGTGLSGTSLTGPIPTLNVDAAQTGITSLGTLTALTVDNIGIDGDTITASADLNIIATGNDIAVDTDNFVITSSASQKPFVELKSTTNDNKGSVLQFTSDKGAAGADNDFIGIIDFMGDDAAQTQTRFARITAQVSEADNTDEAGKLTLSVAESDGTTTSLTAGLVLQGEHATDGEVDVTIAAGAASTTTVAGGLIAKTLTVGTTAAIDNSGVWVGGVIPSAKLDADTAHLTTDQTFTGTKTFNETIVGSINGSSATVATIAGLAPNTATTQATQPAIESIGTDGDTLNILGDNLAMVSTTASKPAIFLTNKADDATSPVLTFTNQRVDSSTQAGEDSDILGKIIFQGYDDQGTPGLHGYAVISSHIHDATSGEESGKLIFSVANHDGGVGSGLVLTGGSEDNEIDVTLGLGANSVVTIPGDIDLEGDIDVNGTLETDALTIGGATIAAIGTTAITTLGTIGTGVWNATAIASAKMATGTASAQGALELATTGEADTGTDTARAVTPAGLKSHVDANARKCILRHHAFYVNDNPMVQNNLYFGGNLGHQPSNWNDPQAAGGVIGDTASFTIAKGDENWGMVLPFDISKVEVQCSLQPQLGTSDDFTVAIYTGIRPNDSASALTLTLAAHQSIAFSSGSNRTMINDVSLTADLAKNTMIYVGLGSEDNTDAKNGRGYLTVTVTER